MVQNPSFVASASRIAIDAGSLDLSYSLRVDVQRFASSTSQIAIGLWL